MWYCPYLCSRCGFITRPSPRESATSLSLSLLVGGCGGTAGGLASSTLKPLWLIGQRLTRNLNFSDSMSCRQRVEEKTHSLQCPTGGQRKTDREGERKNTRLLQVMRRPLQSLHELWFSIYPQVFNSKHLRIIPSLSFYTQFFGLSHNFTASLKRKSINHSVQICESLNRWKTSTERQRFPTGPPAACKMVWISVATN